jgi:protease-4
MNEYNTTGQKAQQFYNRKPKKSKWWVPIVIIGIILVFIITVLLVIGSFMGAVFDKAPVEVKNNSVLELNLGSVLDEYASEGPISFISKSHGIGFLEVLMAVKIAKDDDRIKGIYISSRSTSMGYAKAKELMDALEDFRKSGKFIYSYIETGNEADYFKALPSDKIFMPNEGLLEMNGFAASSLFYKGFLNKYGIDVLVDQHEDYKSFGESYSRTKFSDSAKKETRELINQRYDLFKNQVSYFRGMRINKIDSIIKRGIYSSQEMLENGLVDSLMSENDVKDYIKHKIYGRASDSTLPDKEKKVNYISIANYYNSDLPEMKNVTDGARIAIINGVGAISSRKNPDPFGGGEKSIASKEFVKYLKEARENSKIKAILIRIDSPGGSVIASDEIYEEIIKTRKIKPVYASMSDVAASGGYYIAMACDTIIAHPQTITGSIGVISVIPNFSGLLSKLDITVDTIATSPSAVELNPLYQFSEANKAKLHALTGGMYKRFVSKVAEARHMTFEQTRAIAKGRVWSGTDAKRIGLVDTLGGIQTAINIVKNRLGLTPDQKIKVDIYPKPKDDFISLFSIFDNDSEENSGDYSALIRNAASKNSDFFRAYSILPATVKSQVKYMLNLMNMSEKEKVLMAMPEILEFN